MRYEEFRRQFGPPRARTGADTETLGLLGAEAVAQFVREVGGGVFAGGLVSVASVRERVGDLGGWQTWLPAGARLFACSAFGTLFVLAGDDVWVVNTQYGEIIEADLRPEEVIADLASAETREDILQEGLFESWRSAGVELPDDSVLCPVPALPLGGEWTTQNLSLMSLPVYLSYTAQLFGTSENAVHVIRRGQ